MDSVQAVLQYVSPEETFNLAQRLVSIPSDFAAGTREVAIFLRDFLIKEGLTADIQVVQGVKHVNLVVKMPGEHRGWRLWLNGHLDTVPFSPNTRVSKLREGKLYGRGAADMKGSVAAMAMTLIALRRARVPLQYGVLFTGVAGEEIGGLGTKAFLDSGERAEMAIVGEPTELRLVIAHKGVEWSQIVLEGRSAHASYPEEGVNAISWGAKVIQALELWAKSYKTKRRHPLLGFPTLNVGVFQGGIAPNVVPDRCEIRTDRRWLPNENIQQIYAELENIITSVIAGEPRLQVHISRIEETKHAIPVETPINHPLVSSMQKALIKNGLTPEPQGVPYGTDASWLSQFKIPSVICGAGSILQAHTDEEFVRLEEVWLATKIYLTAIIDLCSDLKV